MKKKDVYYELVFYSNWHCGSGLTAGADLDLLVIKDSEGFPFVPGKTIKGLLKEAIETICEFGEKELEAISLLNFVLGSFDSETKEAEGGCAFFSNAQFQEERDKILDHSLSKYMYNTVASTAMKNGVADEHSLRTMETTIPCTLHGKVLNVPENFIPLLEKGMKFVKRLGQNRNRGLGQCAFVKIQSKEIAPIEGVESIVVKKNTSENEISFKCTLLTDIVLNQKAATEGKQETLDFIPGSNFLGIAASIYKQLEVEDSLLAFHSGKVRFGDAHPSVNNKRSLRIPASIYQPKLKSKEDAGLYIHHEVIDFNNLSFRELQPKQCREGFYLFEDKKIKEIKINKTFNLKSAYNRDNRRSSDGDMYGYQSLQAGTDWLFDLTFENDVPEDLIQKIAASLVGEKRVGRSKSAQYGLVTISVANETRSDVQTIIRDSRALVYADARLIFIDDCGQINLQPSPKDLGFSNGEIKWEKSQIRTFQYAPWNFKRQARDADRCGIEKGSVFYIEAKDGESVLSYPSECVVGVYKNEGFGRIIINPDFLSAKANTNGLSEFEFEKACTKSNVAENTKSLNIDSGNSLLLNYLISQQKKSQDKVTIYNLVNEFTKKHEKRFASDSFASQWGSIRNFALQYPDKATLQDKLFSQKEGYIYKGVSKDKWADKERNQALVSFFNQLGNKNHQAGIINLASEMAKISAKK